MEDPWGYIEAPTDVEDAISVADTLPCWVTSAKLSAMVANKIAEKELETIIDAAPPSIQEQIIATETDPMTAEKPVEIHLMHEIITLERLRDEDLTGEAAKGYTVPIVNDEATLLRIFDELKEKEIPGRYLGGTRVPFDPETQKVTAGNHRIVGGVSSSGDKLLACYYQNEQKRTCLLGGLRKNETTPTLRALAEGTNDGRLTLEAHACNVCFNKVTKPGNCVEPCTRLPKNKPVKDAPGKKPK